MIIFSRYSKIFNEKISTLIKEELENQENYIAGEKDLQKVRDLLHTVEYRKKQHAEVRGWFILN